MSRDPKYFEVTSKKTNNVYHAVIHDGNLIGRIYFGNRKCMMMTVYKNRKDDPDSFYAHLDGISHNSFCSLNGNLPKGGGTKDMLATGVTFLFAQYPWLKGVKFIDASFVECALKNEIQNLPLHSLELAKYGQTWYAKNFGAYPEEKEYAAKIDAIPAQLEQNFKKYKGSFDKFFAKYIMHQAIELEENQLELLQSTFEKSRSFSSWIQRIIRTHHLKCHVLLNWLNAYIYKSDTNISNVYWIINKTVRIEIGWKQIDGTMISAKQRALLGGGSFKFSKSKPRQLM